MKYFIDTHDKTKGSFPKEELTEQQFFDNFDALDKAADQFGAFGHAAHVSLTGEWQPFVVLFGDLAIDPTFGFRNPGPFTEANAEAGQTVGSKNVYGVNWQGQKNSIADAGAVGIDFWVDDVYFIQ